MAGLSWNWEMEPTWRHGPVAGTVNGAATAFTAAAVAHAAHLDPAVMAGVGGAGALAALVTAARAGLSGASAAYRAGCLACAGGWATWAAATSPWQVDRVGALAAGAVGLGLLAPVLGRHERVEAAREERRRAITARGQVAGDWAARLASIAGARGARVVGLKTWEWQVDGEPTGYTLDVDLAGGATWKRVGQFADELAGDARLPEGCGVEVGPGSHRGACVIRVSTVNALAADVDYPADYSPLTVNAPLQSGVYRDGSPAVGEYRQSCALVIGQTGSGKTNELQVTNANLVRCVDTLVWHIDLNGGGIALPWVLPWWESLGGDAPLANPAVDWVAPDGAEALRMARVALGISRDRKTRYQGLMRKVNDDKLPVTPDVPEIVIVVDEMAPIMGEDSEHPRVRDLLKNIQNEGRAGAVRIVFGGLRATAEMIGGTNVKKQAGLRIGMRVTDQEELQYLFGSLRGISIEDAPYPGCGHLALGQAVPRPFKAWRIKPHQIGDVAAAVAGIRPALDPAGVAVGGRDYADRWNRAVPWLTAAAGGAGPAVGPGRPTGGEHETDDEAPAPAGDLPTALAGLDDARARLREAVAAADADPGGPDHDAVRDGTQDDYDRAFTALVAGMDDAAPSGPDTASPAAGDEATATDPKARVMALLRAAGPAGTSAGDIHRQLAAEGHPTTRQTVSDWLQAAVAAGQAAQPVRRGPYIHGDYLTGGDTP